MQQRKNYAQPVPDLTQGRDGQDSSLQIRYTLCAADMSPRCAANTPRANWHGQFGRRNYAWNQTR